MTSTLTTDHVPTLQGLRTTGSHRHTLILRIIAGVPLFVIGMAHILAPEAPMEPLVEAAGFPAPSLVAPIGVAAEVIAGLSLLLGAWARLGGLAAIPVMLGAVYSHLVIDVWPNEAANEPPLALPIVVALAAGYVVVRGAGRWSLDHRQRSGS